MGHRFDKFQRARKRTALRRQALRDEAKDLGELLNYIGTLEWELNSANLRIEILKTAKAETCPNGLLPDGATCPGCGCKRAPSGVDGGSWVHVR